MKTFPVFQLDAVLHKDMITASKVFSVPEFDYFLFVRVPELFARSCSLYQVDEIVDKAHFVCSKELWDHEPGRIWYRFKSHMLNLHPGLHVYRLSFVNTSNNETYQLYISYVVQDSDPNKPYDYMHRGRLGVCGCCESRKS